MTTRKDEAQLAKANMVKVARTAIRLKHTIIADAELNQVLPDLEDAFDKAVAGGRLPGDVNVKALVAEVLS